MSNGADTATNDIRPIVPTGGAGRWEIWLFVPLLLIGGYWLFSTLSDAREAANAPSALTQDGPATTRIASPQPLGIPDRFANSAPLPSASESERPAAPFVRETPQFAPREFPTPDFILPPAPRPILPPPPAPVTVQPAPEPVVVYEQSVAAIDARSGERVLAGRLVNPSRTIPQGTVIPAVLETALDSTRPGGARALVQRDVSSFDGTRVLIPRGSRLYGEYKADLRPGQRRALVQWQRLVRPDGVTIQLDSPSADALGRAGVRGKVDSNFFERFGGAILQTVLDIGAGLAINEASDNVVIALPGSNQVLAQTGEQAVARALKVKHGASVSVFVARDLDFSSVEP